jgi:hypothetical protein
MKVILSVPYEGYSERTLWRLFWTYPMKVILSVPYDGYSERTLWRLFWAYPMKVILNVPYEGYSERTLWRLFHKRILCTKFDIYFFILMLIQMRWHLELKHFIMWWHLELKHFIMWFWWHSIWFPRTSYAVFPIWMFTPLKFFYFGLMEHWLQQFYFSSFVHDEVFKF